MSTRTGSRLLVPAFGFLVLGASLATMVGSRPARASACDTGTSVGAGGDNVAVGPGVSVAFCDPFLGSERVYLAQLSPSGASVRATTCGAGLWSFPFYINWCADRGVVSVSNGGDAEGFVAVSNGGHAHGSWLSFFEVGHLDGTGVSNGGSASGGMAIAPTGQAAGDGTSLSATGPASGGFYAISGTQAATADAYAVSALGNADGGYAAVSGLGDAHGDQYAVTVTGDAYSDGVAVSVTGEAHDGTEALASTSRRSSSSW